MITPKINEGNSSDTEYRQKILCAEPVKVICGDKDAEKYVDFNLFVRSDEILDSFERDMEFKNAIL